MSAVAQSSARQPPSSAQLPTVTVVVCAYTDARWELISRGVSALERQDHAPDQCVLVIDHNEDLLRRARTAFGDRVTVVPNEEEPGLSGARNTGIGHSTSDVVCFLDDDAEAEGGCLRELLSHYDTEDVVGTGGVAEPVWPTGRRPRWLPAEFDWVVGCSYTGLPSVVAPVRNPIGCVMSMRRAVLEKLGGFSSSFGQVGEGLLGCDETELAVRARQQIEGARFLHVPGAVVHHHVSAERTRFAYFLRRCYSEGIAKERLARRAGRADALSSERHYTTRTLPRAVLRAVADTLRGDPMGPVRAATVVTGLAATAAGYFRSAAVTPGRWRRRTAMP